MSPQYLRLAVELIKSTFEFYIWFCGSNIDFYLNYFFKVIIVVINRQNNKHTLYTQSFLC